jgi:hypothetical protein
MKDEQFKDDRFTVEISTAPPEDITGFVDPVFLANLIKESKKKEAARLADAARLSATGIEAVELTVNRYYPDFLPSVKACLAVFGSMSLKGRQMCLCLILTGPSGSGKSTVVRMFFYNAKTDPIYTNVYRSDHFTPKAFVTHSASMSEAKRKEADMLPKLNDHVLLTKELAPMFRGKDDELRQTFGLLISVLDGDGHTSDSGAAGRRGYDEKILFNWVGATTPIPPAIHQMMGQLGTRFLFFEVPHKAPTDAELDAHTKSDEREIGATECRAVVNACVVDFMERHPIGSVDPASIEIDDDAARAITRWTQLLCRGRATLSGEKTGKDGPWKATGVESVEAPWKVIDYFKELARGHALMHGRAYVNADDIELVAHVALSSMPLRLSRVLRGLRTTPVLTTEDVRHLCRDEFNQRISPATAINAMRDLKMLGVVDLDRGIAGHDPFSIRLAEKFRWLGPAPEPEVPEAEPEPGAAAYVPPPPFTHVPLDAVADEDPDEARETAAAISELQREMAEGAI